MTKAVFPGSFDPFHNGHLEIVERAHKIFTKLVVAVMANPQKSEPLFTGRQRMQMISECVSSHGNVEVVQMGGLVVDLARELEADVLVRGLRAVSDFENELQMAQMNHRLSGIETLFVPSGTEQSFLSSRLIREVASLGGDVSSLVPGPVAALMKEHFS